MGAGVGSYDLSTILGFFHYLIQHHNYLKFIFIGTYSWYELESWSYHLIDAITINITFLEEAEALQLIEKPLANSNLSYHPQAIQRILELTGCHPYLIQLLCSNIIDKKNEDAQPSWVISRPDVEIVIHQVLEDGSLFFVNLEKRIREFFMKYQSHFGSHLSHVELIHLYYLAKRPSQSNDDFSYDLNYGMLFLYILVRNQSITFDELEKIFPKNYSSIQKILGSGREQIMIEFKDCAIQFKVGLIREWFLKKWLIRIDTLMTIPFIKSMFEP